jgi:hypothetical protein
MKIFSLFIERQERGLPPTCPGKLLLGEIPDISKTITDRYELIPTGFLIDTTSFKPELTFILYIKNEKIHETLSNYVSGCWEADIGEYDLSGNAFCGNFFKFLGKNLSCDTFLPAGAVAVGEGIKWYTTYLH